MSGPPQTQQISQGLVQSLKNKDFSHRLQDLLHNLVMSRRSYLNHSEENWQAFLDNSQQAYMFLNGGSVPDRSYRDSFTIENYRMLFQREGGSFRDDVCRGVKRIRDVDAIPFSTRVSTIQRFRDALMDFDSKYTIFEKNYIEALISVEKKSRNLVQNIAEQIKMLEIQESDQNQDQMMTQQYQEEMIMESESSQAKVKQNQSKSNKNNSKSYQQSSETSSESDSESSDSDSQEDNVNEISLEEETGLNQIQNQNDQLSSDKENQVINTNDLNHCQNSSNVNQSNNYPNQPGLGEMSTKSFRSAKSNRSNKSTAAAVAGTLKVEIMESTESSSESSSTTVTNGNTINMINRSSSDSESKVNINVDNNNIEIQNDSSFKSSKKSTKFKSKSSQKVNKKPSKATSTKSQFKSGPKTTQQNQILFNVNQQLLDQMAELNKKSRDCFNCSYSVEIMEIVLSRSYEKTGLHERLWYIPQELLERYFDICKYLKDLLPKILRVHPKLEHNPGLVQRLEKFHESYRKVGDWVSFKSDQRMICHERYRKVGDSNWVILYESQNPMSQFCYFLDEITSINNSIQDSDSDNFKVKRTYANIDLDGSVDSILLIPRLFLLFVWKNRKILMHDQMLEKEWNKQNFKKDNNTNNDPGSADASDAGGGGGGGGGSTAAAQTTQNQSQTQKNLNMIIIGSTNNDITNINNISPPQRSPVTKLVQDLHPELLVELSTILVGTKYLESESDLDSDWHDLAKEAILVNGIDSDHPSGLSKAWERVSIGLQRENASAWNSFVSVILHEDEDEGEKRARPRLPSV